MDHALMLRQCFRNRATFYSLGSAGAGAATEHTLGIEPIAGTAA